LWDKRREERKCKAPSSEKGENQGLLIKAVLLNRPQVQRRKDCRKTNLRGNRFLKEPTGGGVFSRWCFDLIEKGKSGTSDQKRSLQRREKDE